MIELWIPITIFAAFSQNIRSALQKHLTKTLSTAGATQARFIYALPFALIYLIAIVSVSGVNLPEPPLSFYAYVITGAIAQIVATGLLLAVFSYRNFFIGASFSKTETLQTALIGFVLLADQVTLGALLGIILGIFGVVIIANGKDAISYDSVRQSLVSKAAVLGTLSGLGFGIAAVCFRGASLTLSGGVLIQSAFTLFVALCIQTTLMSLYLTLKERGQMTLVIKSWSISSIVGATGMMASAGWFAAMTLQNAAYIKALGQIELIFAFLVSAIFFKEKTTRLELLGVTILSLGIIVLLLFR